MSRIRPNPNIRSTKSKLVVQAVKAAAEMIPLLYPEVGADARPMLVQTLAHLLLQLSELSLTGGISVRTSSDTPFLPDSAADDARGHA